MARIRTIKPEFFRHSGLYDAEKETGLPLRVAFAGLWTAADREGRFAWKPRQLKLDCLPYDEVDFSRVLDALATRGHLVKYRVNGVDYGCIPSWKVHQFINNREQQSEIPAPSEDSIKAATSTRDGRVDDAMPTRLEHAQGEGEGERKGKGREVKPSTGAAHPSPEINIPHKTKPTAETWKAYSDAYYGRYNVEPVRNAKVNGMLAHLVSRLGGDSPHVAAHYVRSNSRIYATSMHCVDLLLRDAEKLRTEWATGRTGGAMDVALDWANEGAA